ncbi:phage recombination protein Bet [Oscillibacter ruminantium]|uniref:phage recombination protein Bet n=1 Tax=Oscillibacter ruminantium TaxID=1263547 RepID=UPI00332BEFFF
MALNNTLAKKQDDQVIRYDSNGTEIKLSPAIVRNYLVNGNGDVTNQEVVMFLNLCKAQHLNPFLREAYLIKFGNQPATIVTGKEVFTKRARRNKDFAGYEAGIIVQNEAGELESRSGTLHIEGEQIVGGWAKVHIRGYDVPIEASVSFDEYCLKKDGHPASNWAAKPGTMIRKVALVQALREAFPEELQGMYSAEEMDVQATLDETPIQEPDEQPIPQEPEADPLA